MDATLNIFAATGYRFTASLELPANLHNVEPVQVYQWGTRRVGSAHPTGAGQFLGYAASGYGAHHSVARGPVRATLAEAQSDADRPTAVLWRVVGYLCG